MGRSGVRVPMGSMRAARLSRPEERELLISSTIRELLLSAATCHYNLTFGYKTETSKFFFYKRRGACMTDSEGMQPSATSTHPVLPWVHQALGLPVWVDAQSGVGASVSISPVWRLYPALPPADSQRSRTVLGRVDQSCRVLWSPDPKTDSCRKVKYTQAI